jgi:UDP-2,3-diacylglucosamine pyrophosphatase LpxH
MTKKTWRAIWISDVHLGTRGCKATLLHSFLKAHKCEKLFLVGDIIDGWRISTTKWYWPGEHNKVVREILRKSEKEDTKVYYIPGNHDEFLRDYIAEHQFQMGNIQVIDEAYHVTKKGEMLWVIHGDAFDGVTRHHRWVALLGDAAYDFLLWSNRWVNLLRRTFNMPYWSLAGALKHKVKTAVNFIFEFESAVAREAMRRNADGVVCGHIHHAEKKLINGVNYYNCGDWVESCTAIVEDESGELQIIRWAEQEGLHSNVIPLDKHREQEIAA